MTQLRAERRKVVKGRIAQSSMAWKEKKNKLRKLIILARKRDGTWMKPNGPSQLNGMPSASSHSVLTLAKSAPTLLPRKPHHALQSGPCRVTLPRMLHGIRSLTKAQTGLECGVVVRQGRRDGQGRKGRREQGVSRASFQPPRQ